MIELIFYTFGIMLFFAGAGAIAWALDKVLTFHMEGMERVRKLSERERAGK
jgi:hypothetical protein